MWEDLPAAYASAAQAPVMIGKGPRLADGKRYVVILMDFNTPNARDALVMGKVAKAVQNLTVTQVSNHCVVLAIMATRSKEDTTDDPMDDEKTVSYTHLTLPTIYSV